MFQFFRRKDKAVRILLGAILVMVCLMLVVTLIPGLTNDPVTDELVLARVGQESITGPEITRQLQMMTRGSRLPPSLLPLYAPQVLNQMVTEKAVIYEARRLGLDVPPDELAAELAQNPQFFPEGKFIGDDEYRGLVETRFNMTVPQFEEKYRDSLVSEKLRRVVTAGVTVGEDEIVREFHRRNDKFRFDYVALKTEDVKKTLEPSEAEINDFFQKNKQRYQVAERRQFRFVFGDTNKLRDTLSVEDSELQRYYKDNSDRFRVPDRAKVSHVLFKTVGKNPQEIEEVRKKAEGVLEKARKGEDFAALAKQNSDDAATSGKGGDLGWIVRGQTVPEFEKTAFTLETGRIGDVIKTTYGFHIVKVHERERAHQQSFEEVRGQILPQVRQEKAMRAAEQLAEKAEGALRKQQPERSAPGLPGNLQGIAGQLGLPVMDSGLIKRGDPLPQAGSSPQAEDALFSGNLKQGQLTSVLQAPNGFIIAQLAQVSPAHPAELAEVRDQVISEWKNERATQVAAERMKQLAEQARIGDLKKAAATQKLTMKTSELVARDGSIPDAGAAAALIEAAAAMKAGDVGAPVASTDGQVVFRLVEKQEATPDPAAKDTLRRELVEAKRNTYYQLYIDNLKTRLERDGKLRVFDAAMKRMTASLE